MVVLLAFAESAIQLVPDGTIIFHIFLILLMVGVLNRTLFRPINQILAEREAQTEGSIREAHSIIGNVQQKMQDYERSLREARGEGYQLMEQRKLQSLREREQRIAELKSEISDWSDKQKAELQKEVQKARAELADNSRRLAGDIAARILQRPVAQ